MIAVTQGAHLPLDALEPRVSSELRGILERALLVDASARPELDALKRALLAEPGVSELPSRWPSERRDDAASRKPWWRRW